MSREIIIPEDLEPNQDPSKTEAAGACDKEKVKLRQLPALKVPGSLYNKLALECFERNIKMKTLLWEIVYKYLANKSRK